MEKFAYYIKALKNYAKFRGRANREEFWYFVLFNFIITLIFVFINKNLGNIYSLLVLIPGLALGTRRLHDIGKSGWWQLLSFIPFIGVIWLIILFAKKGDEGENEYGKPSKGLSVTDVFDLDDTKEKLSDLGDKVSEKAEKIVDKTKEVGEKVSDKLEDLGEKTGDKIEKTVDTVTDKVEDFTDKVKDTLDEK